MVPADCQVLLHQYNVSRESSECLERYVDLLLAWQKRINLIGPSTVHTVWTRHIIDAVQLIPLLPKGTVCIADLGSGAGIPGLVVAIAMSIKAHLYESNGKKTAFLQEAIRRTQARAEVHQVRLEALARQSNVPVVDAVTARALAPLHLLLEYAAPFMAGGAPAFFHKGQDIEQELTEATKYWRVQSIRHASRTDSRGVILEVTEAIRV